ncbi:TBC1 domain family member 5 [Ditylenchus destructor]|nr:TBC1 domain family member 5 [Ditylenchus destructor]
MSNDKLIRSVLTSQNSTAERFTGARPAPINPFLQDHSKDRESGSQHEKRKPYQSGRSEGPHKALTLEHVLFSKQDLRTEDLEQSCLNGKLRDSRFRSLVWRILLKVLPVERSDWRLVVTRTRKFYDDLKHIEESPSDRYAETLDFINDTDYLEHDAFSLFRSVMMLIEGWYDTGPYKGFQLEKVPDEDDEDTACDEVFNNNAPSDRRRSIQGNPSKAIAINTANPSNRKTRQILASTAFASFSPSEKQEGKPAAVIKFPNAAQLLGSVSSNEIPTAELCRIESAVVIAKEAYGEISSLESASLESPPMSRSRTNTNTAGSEFRSRVSSQAQPNISDLIESRFERKKNF